MFVLDAAKDHHDQGKHSVPFALMTIRINIMRQRWIFIIKGDPLEYVSDVVSPPITFLCIAILAQNT
ncbi:MAG: hypothetical protein DRJ03_00550 [Chloroflexi bacterium]|nr:MAG: hypothetical protein DRJ03_00550 [Chloroflexota bacterium]